MSLKALKLLTKEVPVTADQTITVRGLSLDDVTVLVFRHRSAIQEVYDKTVGKKVDELHFDEVATSLVLDAPLLVADAIALATGELDDETQAIARQLPFTTQLFAIEAIGELTFTSEAAVKKVVETVIRVMESATQALNSLQAPA